MSALPRDSLAPHLQFKYYLGGDILILQCSGLYSMGSIFKNVEPAFYFWEKIPFICAIGTLVCGISCDIRKIAANIVKYSLNAIEIIAIVMCATLGTFKGYRICSYRREFHHFIKALYLDWDKELSQNTITEKMLEDANSMRLFRTWYGTVIAAIFGSYVIRPCLAYYRFKLSGTNDTFDFTQTVYPAMYPFTLTTPLSFFCCVTIETMGVIYLTLYWTAADGLFAQLTTQLAIQFQILANRLRYMPIQEITGPNHTRIVVQQLKKTVQDYLKLFK